MIKIVSFNRQNQDHIQQGAALLAEAVPHSYSEEPLKEMARLLDQKRIAIDDNVLIGFIGAIPQYGITGWELHQPLFKKASNQKGLAHS